MTFLKKQIYKSSVLVILIMFISACSNTNLLYTLAKNYIQNEITYFVYLNEEERVLMTQQVSEMIIWHRTSMLPSYATYLTNIADKIKAGQYKHSDINEITSNGRFLIEKTVIGLTPYASKFLMNHRKIESIEFMEKKIMKRQQDRLDELSESENVLYKNRLKRLTSGFERFFGALTNEQLIILEAYTNETLNDKRIRLNNRIKRQRVFLEFLKTQPNEASLSEYLNKLLLRGHEIVNSTHQEFSEASLERFQKLLFSMLETSSKIQRDKIVSKMLGYAEDFKKISNN